MKKKIFLPGTDQQVKLLTEILDVSDKEVLIIGGGTEEIARDLKAKGAREIIIIVNDNDSLLTSRLILVNEPGITVRMMEYDNTDFREPKFDLIYAQGSVSNKKRNKILKEAGRILKPGGYFCVGESTSLSPRVPMFVSNVWQSSDISPLEPEDAKKLYVERNFEINYEYDLSYTLEEFYKKGKSLLEEKSPTLTEKEKSYYKKLLKQLNHESNVYLKHGGNKYMGFMMYILKKGKE